jgi:hypothetical protein
MAEIRTVTTLRSKRAEILAPISPYEKRLAQARADLAHVTGCIAIFEASGDSEELSSYVDTHRMFARRNDSSLQGGLDTGDKVLAHAVAHRMIHALRQQWRRGQFTGPLEGEGR